MDDLPFGKSTAPEVGANRFCPTTGTLKRDCDCYRCRGRRSQQKGDKSQTQSRRKLEKAFGKSAGNAVHDEEDWRLPVRIEVKSGADAKPTGTFYRNTKAQAQARKSIGDTRAFIALAVVEGEELCVIRLADLRQLLAEQRK